LDDALAQYAGLLNNLLGEIKPVQANEGDWSFLQTALQVLQTAKVLQRRLHAFDIAIRNQLKARLPVLLSAIAANLKAASGDAQAVAPPPAPPPPGGGGALAQGHDLAVVVYPQVQGNPAALAKLKALEESLGVLGERLLASPARRVKAFQEAAEQLAYDHMFRKAKIMLGSVTSLEAWSAVPTEGRGGIALPSFSMSPQTYITQVGEHLLMLPQHLEPFSATFAAATTGRSTTDQQGTDADRADAFTAMWLSKLARGCADLYVTQILVIPRLSEQGTKQLVADIEYLVNVLKALGVTPHPKLGQCVEALQADEAEFKRNTKEGGAGQLFKAIGIKRGF